MVAGTERLTVAIFAPVFAARFGGVAIVRPLQFTARAAENDFVFEVAIGQISLDDFDFGAAWETVEIEDKFAKVVIVLTILDHLRDLAT